MGGESILRRPRRVLLGYVGPGPTSYQASVSSVVNGINGRGIVPTSPACRDVTCKVPSI